MDFDVVLREVRLPGTKPDKPATDIGVKDGRIAAISAGLGGTAREEYRGGGRLVCSGFVDTHIHLDKACILGRCEHTTKRNPHLAMERVSAVKHTFTIEDVIERASATIEKCISHGATRMRTHAEVDPKVGLRGFEGVKALIDKYKWAIDLEICVMPQEGLTNNPGTDELMVAALKNGATVVGAAPNYDSDWRAQIRRIFEMAREFDVDIDMHLDSGASAEELHTLLVCDLTEKYKWGGRVAVGHVGKLATMPFKDLDKVARRMADAGVAATDARPRAPRRIGRNFFMFISLLSLCPAGGHPAGSVPWLRAIPTGRTSMRVKRRRAWENNYAAVQKCVFCVTGMTILCPNMRRAYKLCTLFRHMADFLGFWLPAQNDQIPAIQDSFGRAK